ncbi:MAG: YggS family pyridoxal phosphate-dependent enzyme [Gammaproteobacteria bacterium]|nr:YggS family pyridoxal phosphate-dependent enzyme [Gammaproteobacteria bacterium]MCY4217985.1 YggS family pyridoxal phosphate-dependent enzyme [Gammaproteobacteria bacterium]
MKEKVHSIQNPVQGNYGDSASRYNRILDRIRDQVQSSKRPEGSTKLIAVSKQHPAEAVVELARLGQTDFAENYVQESLQKIQSVKTLLKSDSLPNPLCWHFIGHIQSRKCRDIAENFDWVHTIDSPKIARRLDSFRNQKSMLQSLIQVNLQNETGKAGVQIEELTDLTRLVDSLPNLELRGLMIIPRLEKNYDLQCEVFRELREILEQYQSCYPSMNQLSMGMSNDMAAAIHEGATMVRIGTAIFGPRP